MTPVPTPSNGPPRPPGINSRTHVIDLRSRFFFFFFFFFLKTLFFFFFFFFFFSIKHGRASRVLYFSSSRSRCCACYLVERRCARVRDWGPYREQVRPLAGPGAPSRAALTVIENIDAGSSSKLNIVGLAPGYDAGVSGSIDTFRLWGRCSPCGERSLAGHARLGLRQKVACRYPPQ